jgi:hypothetical protein
LATRRLPLLSVVFDFDGTLAKLNIDFSLMRQQVLDLIAGYRIPLPPNGLRDLFVLEMVTAGAALVSQYQPGSPQLKSRRPRKAPFLTEPETC